MAMLVALVVGVLLALPLTADALSITTIPVGADPVAVGVNMTTNKIYVANFLGNSVTVFVL